MGAPVENRSNEPGWVLRAKTEVMNPVMRDSALLAASGSLLRFLQVLHLRFFRRVILGFITGFITSILAGCAAASEARVNKRWVGYCGDSAKSSRIMETPGSVVC